MTRAYRYLAHVFSFVAGAMVMTLRMDWVRSSTFYFAAVLAAVFIAVLAAVLTAREDSREVDRALLTQHPRTP